MPRLWRRAAIIGATLVLVLLGGCSALRLGYTQGPTLAYWWLDSYLDFDAAQRVKTRDALAQWFAWHRKSELPQLALLLDRAAVEVMADASADQACRWFESLQARVDAALEHALPLAAGVAVSLRPEQLEAMRERQARANDDFRDEYLQPRPEARAKADLERTLERTEMLYGRFGTQQREKLQEIIAASAFDPERWLVDRQRRQRDLLQTLRQMQSAGMGQAEAQAALRGYWQRARRSPDEAYARYAQQLNAYNCAAAAQIHNLTTAAQRDHAQKRLRGWEADLHSLSAP
jgi:Family of unknown function (DUF6279)